MLLPTSFGVVATDRDITPAPASHFSQVALKGIAQKSFLVCCERASFDRYLGALLALLSGVTFVLYDGQKAPNIEAIHASPGRVSTLKVGNLEGGETFPSCDVVIVDKYGYLASATDSQFATLSSAAHSGSRLFILTPYLARDLDRSPVILARKLTLLNNKDYAENLSVVKRALEHPEDYLSLFDERTWIALAEKKVSWRVVKGMMRPAEAAEYEALEGRMMTQEDHGVMRSFHLVPSKERAVRAYISAAPPDVRLIVYAPLPAELASMAVENGRYTCTSALDASWPKPDPGEKWMIVLLKPTRPHVIRWMVEKMYAAGELHFCTFVWGRQRREDTADQHFWKIYSSYDKAEDAIHSTLHSVQKIPSAAFLPSPSPDLISTAAPPDSSVDQPNATASTFLPSPSPDLAGPGDFTLIDHESLEESPPIVSEEEAMQGVTLELGNHEAAPPPPVAVYSDVPKDLLAERRYKQLAGMVIETRDWWTPDQLELFEEALCRLDPSAPRFDEHIEDVLRKVDRYAIERHDTDDVPA